MSLKLLLDAGVPRSAATVLRGDGLDAIHVGEIGMSTATDADILDLGSTQGRVIVTLDLGPKIEATGMPFVVRF
ncbi:MAG: DUF5615 family PIN-like protein [Minicystis sp.]